MKRIIVALAFILTTTTFVSAQAPIKVRILMATGATEDAVRAYLLPLISADAHYALVNDGSWDVIIKGSCVAPSQTIACAYVFEYSPDKYLGVMTNIGGGISVGPNSDTAPNRVSHDLFADLISETTPDAIKKANDVLDTIFGGVVKAAREHDAKPSKNGAAS